MCVCVIVCLCVVALACVRRGGDRGRVRGPPDQIKN